MTLLQHFREQGATRLVVAGVSQGGLHAAMVRSVMGREADVAVVAAFAPHSAAPVFTRGALADVVDWQVLGEGARERLAGVLKISDIHNFPMVHGNSPETLFFAEHDRYVHDRIKRHC